MGKAMLNRLTIRSDQASRVGLVMILWAIWLCLTPYHGMYQDGRLYSMLALNYLNPANFHSDLFVATGSQDHFTLFPALFGNLTRWIGLYSAAFALTAVGQVLWFAALVTLARKIVSGWALVLSIACVVYCSRFYEPYVVFAYAEQYPTPRIFAEALGMLALPFIFERRYWRALPCMLVSVLFHPLMSAYFCFVLLVSFLTDRAWNGRLRAGLAVALVVLGGLLWALHIPPFANFLHGFDPQWWLVFAVSTPSATFPMDWSLGGVLRVVYFMLVLGVAWREDIPVLGRRVPLLLGCALFLLLVWVIGCVGWHDLLLSQLQLWRCVWVLQILALLAYGPLLIKLWQAGRGDRWLAGLMVAALLQLGFNVSDGSPALYCLLAGLVVRALFNRLPGETFGRRPWSLLPALLPVPLLLINALKAWNLRAPQLFSASPASYTEAAILGAAGLAVAAIGWFVLLRREGRQWRTLVALACGLASVSVAAFVWSNPFLTENTTLDATQRSLISDLRARIPEGSVVFSTEGIFWNWFVLERSNYIHHYQMSGGVFSRQASVEGFRRTIFLCQAGVPGCPGQHYEEDSLRDPQAFWQAHSRPLCSDPVLDFLVLRGANVSGSDVLRFGPGADQILSVVDCHRQRETHG